MAWASASRARCTTTAAWAGVISSTSAISPTEKPRRTVRSSTAYWRGSRLRAASQTRRAASAASASSSGPFSPLAMAKAASMGSEAWRRVTWLTARLWATVNSQGRIFSASRTWSPRSMRRMKVVWVRSSAVARSCTVRARKSWISGAWRS